MTQYSLDVAGLTDQGMKRDHNEDAWSGPPADLTAEQIMTKGWLYVVADGVGGHQAGDVASAMAVEIVPRHYYADSSPDIAVSLTAAIQEANQEIYQEAEAKTEQYGMGTTITVAVLHDDTLTVANVGDSRAYLIRKGQARQITTDHTWVEEQVRIGLITRKEAAKHPQRNIITRSLGSQLELQVDIFKEHVEAGDNILLCSDGLSNLVPNPEIGDIVSRSKSARTATHALVELAKERGAPDNVTTVLLKTKRERGNLGRWLLGLGIVGSLLLAVGALVFSTLGRDEKDGTSTPTALASPTDTLPATLSSPLAHSNNSNSTAETPAPLAKLDTATPTSLPVDASIPTPELTLPTPNDTLIQGEAILFAWKWDKELKGQDWHFVFELGEGDNSPAIIHKELPLNQRGLGVIQSLEAGAYWWRLAAVGKNRQGGPAQRRLTVVKPTPDPSPIN